MIEQTNNELNKQLHSNRLISVIRFYETLTPQTLDNITNLYAANVQFKDPFNEVNTLEAVKKIFANMFEHVNEPRFKVHTAIEQNNDAFITWDFTFRMKRFNTTTIQCCRGSSHLVFDSNNQIYYHRDYWDAAEELYEKIPVLGGFMRWLKRKVE